ncbi:MAG TPA: protein-L-isoaspartate O-methyltransferase [Thermoplasmata archaeon]|nr:protein-L-isoaspartate O-methyltransferase [Thermoplasmata archaeon]
MKKERERLVHNLWRRGYIKSRRVKEAMLAIPRHFFVPEHLLRDAYIDSPLNIGEGQTISAPHMVAMMAEELDIKKGEKILEIGGGSGYHAAIYGYLTGKGGMVVSIERIKVLVERAEKNLRDLKSYLQKRDINIGEIKFIHGDGRFGYKEESPYHKISVACTAEEIPRALSEQLAEGGKMVIPVGSSLSFFGGQTLVSVEKRDGKLKKRDVCGVAFVPLREGTV